MALFQRLIFTGTDAAGLTGLWITDGTAAGTTEITVTGASASGLDPYGYSAFGTEIAFAGTDSTGLTALWLTNGTAADTSEIANATVESPGTLVPATANSVSVFTGTSVTTGYQGIFATNGTTSGTTQLGLAGSGVPQFGFTGLLDLTPVAGKVVFVAGIPTSAHPEVPPPDYLFVTDGTSAGTMQLAVSGESTGSTGFDPESLTALNASTVLFSGFDASGDNNLWTTDGTAAGTTELIVSGANSGGLSPTGFFVLGSKALFSGADSGGKLNGLWVTDGTAAGTSEITVASASSNGVDPRNFAALGSSRAVFAGISANLSFGQEIVTLFVTDGTTGGTSEITIDGASAAYGLSPSNIVSIGDKVVFSGWDTANKNGLWVSDGTTAGTFEIVPSNASPNGLQPTNIVADGNEVVFSGVDSSGKTDLWITDGTLAGTSIVGATDVSASTGLSPAYFAAIACYAAGTRIATPRGDVAIEELRPGDAVLSHFGGSVPVVWTGQRRIDCTRHPRPESVWPVRIRAGAFGEGLPRRDLFLSPDHAIYVDGFLVPVRTLIDGAAIVQEPRASITYWHVECPVHDVLLAEGLPAESYLDTGNRCAFEGGGPVLQLHPDFAQAKWEAEACAPQMIDGPRHDAIRARLLRGQTPEIGGQSPWPFLRDEAGSEAAPLGVPSRAPSLYSGANVHAKRGTA